MAEEMSDVPERLSPELVLVSPDLAVGARAALPERPWEVYVQPRALAPAEAPAVPLLSLVPDAAEGETDAAVVPVVAGEEWVPAAANVPAATGAALAPATRHPVGHRVPGPASGHRAIALALFALAVVLALTIRPVSDAPTFAKDTPSEALAPAGSQKRGDVTADAKGAAARTGKEPRSAPKPTGGSDVGESPKQATPKQVAVSAKKQSSSDASKSKAEPTAKAKAPAAPRPSPGGYVFGSELRLFVASGGTTIAWFQAVTPCGSNVTIQRIPIASDGTFTARRTVAQRGGRAVVELSGRVVAPRQIHGNLAAKGPGCDRVRRYAAELS